MESLFLLLHFLNYKTGGQSRQGAAKQQTQRACHHGRPAQPFTTWSTPVHRSPSKHNRPWNFILFSASRHPAKEPGGEIRELSEHLDERHSHVLSAVLCGVVWPSRTLHSSSESTTQAPGPPLRAPWLQADGCLSESQLVRLVRESIYLGS